MARVYYIQCNLCQKEYYLEQTLYKIILSDSGQKLKCPYCKKEFYPGLSKSTNRTNDNE